MLKDITIGPSNSIREAMKYLDLTAEKCLLVVDEEKKLLGTLTDGDLRRAILGGKQFSEEIENSYCTKPYYLIVGSYSKDEALNLLRINKLNLIPVLDTERTVVDYITWDGLGAENERSFTLENIPVVIMAGGRGTRLEPFTKVLPKPLVPIHEKTIIEHIIESFTVVKCNNFYLTVNYKGRILKAYFEELNPNYNVNFIDESEPLGTAGSLGFLDEKFEVPFFVTNCDILIKADYLSLYDFHTTGKFDISLVASTKEYIIPYGTCELSKNGHLSHIKEKPSYEFLINTGLYVLNPDVLKLIPENTFLHITHLIEIAKNQGMKVGVFPIDEDAWVDVGQWVEYRNALDKL